MQEYIFPIQVALFLFPFLAFFITLPYIIFQYRKYGSIPVLRTVIVYSFILYLTCAYFLVILPLPSFDQVLKMTGPTTQLIPFSFIGDFLKNTSLVWNQPSTYFIALKEPYIYQVFYNIILLLPFGIYLRYYFHCSFKKTLLLSLGLSLFFEITQLTGLYGIYPRAYRLFDIDDMMLNTLGGLCGYFLTPLVELLLPSRKRLDEVSFERGKEVSYVRRMLALFIDWIIIGILQGISAFFVQRYFLPVASTIVISYFFLSSFLFQGQTIGKRIVKIRIVTEEKETPTWYQYLFRYGLLYGITLILPSFLVDILLKSAMSQHAILSFLLAGGLLLGYLIICFYFLLSIITKRRILFYEKASKTKQISTIL